MDVGGNGVGDEDTWGVRVVVKKSRNLKVGDIRFSKRITES